MPRAKRAPVICNTEHQDQSLLMQWCLLHVTRYPDLAWIYAIPNFSGHYGSDKSRMIAGAKLKKEGRKAGYPDIGLDVARGGYHGLRIELKRMKGGSVSAEQKAWHTRLQAQGYCVGVAKGWEEARDFLLVYLALGDPLVTSLTDATGGTQLFQTNQSNMPTLRILNVRSTL